MKALILMIACLSIALNAGEPDGLVQQTPSAWESAQDSGKDAASQLREQDSVLELEPYIEPAEQALEKAVSQGQDAGTQPDSQRPAGEQNRQLSLEPMQQRIQLAAQQAQASHQAQKAAQEISRPEPDVPVAGEDSQPADLAPVGGYTQEDVDLLARLIYCEMGCAWIPDEQQRNVGSVVLNRIASPLYPNTLREVIYQPGQYSPASSGWLETATPDERTIQNAKWLLENGSILPAGVLGQSTVAQGAVHCSYYDSYLGTTTYYCYLG